MNGFRTQDEASTKESLGAGGWRGGDRSLMCYGLELLQRDVESRLSPGRRPGSSSTGFCLALTSTPIWFTPQCRATWSPGVHGEVGMSVGASRRAGRVCLLLWFALQLVARAQGKSEVAVSSTGRGTPPAAVLVHEMEVTWKM